jgi:hypothetical protein
VLAAAGAFVLIGVLNVNTAYVILLFLVLGVASAIVGGKRTAAAAAGTDDPAPAAEAGRAGAPHVQGGDDSSAEGGDRK